MATAISLPNPTALSQPYWQACARHMLTVQRCRQCGRCFFQPEVACQHCSSLEWDWVPSSGRGTLYSYSVVYRSPVPGMPIPFVFAAVEIDDGYAMFSNVVECAVDDVHIDMRLEVVFDDVAPGISLPKFRPEIVTGR
jgi:uncharacterized protein